MFRREKYLKKIEKQLNDLETILFLMGARQVGKTTLLKSLIRFWYIDENNTLFLQWDELINFWINNYPSFISYIKNKIDLTKLKFLIIDEAQYIENIWFILKILIDKIRWWDYKFKLIVSWSWSLNIFRWITDSLVGRKKIIKVYPFDWEEFLLFKGEQNIFWFENRRIIKYKNLFEEYITFGWYPKVVLTSDPKEKIEILKQIYQDYIFKDIVLFLKEWEIMKFQQFLKLIASKVCSKINISRIIDELWIKRYVFEKFFFLVENTFLIEKVEWFTWWKISKEIKKYYKVYFNDVWLLRYLLGINQWIWDFKGKIVENFIFNWLNVNKQNWQNIFYRNTSSGAEVDFIVQNEVDFSIIPIEVKNTNKDNFWKSYISFFKAYKDIITTWYITTDSLIKERELEWKIVKFIPYVLFHNINFD